MTERANLEDQLNQIQGDLDKASHAFESSVETLTELLGTRDTERINAAKDAMQMWSEKVRILTEERRGTQRALEAAWATFWVALFAMIASTTSTIMAAVIVSAQ
jgi:hypothetical protein